MVSVTAGDGYKDRNVSPLIQIQPQAFEIKLLDPNLLALVNIVSAHFI